MTHRFSNQDISRLVIPLLVEQLLIQLVNMSDIFMASFAGAHAVSGVSLVSMLATFFLYVFMAVGAGGAVIISQYIGRNDGSNANHSAGQLLCVSVFISLALTVLIVSFNRPFLRLLFPDIDPEVMTAAATYQLIIALSFIPLGVYNSGAAICRSINRTDVILKVSVIANVINLAGNYAGIFIFKAGVAGIACSSLIARTYSAIAITMFCVSSKNPVFYSLRNIVSLNSKIIRQILTVAIPGAVENGAFQLVKTILATIIATFGTVQIAANGIAQSMCSFASVPVSVMGSAYITVIGQCMGARDIDEADYYFRKLTKITVAASVVSDIAMICLAPSVMKFYPLSGEIKSLVVLLVFIHCSFNTVTWPFANGLPNGLRAAGDVKFEMMTNIFSTVFVRLSLSYIFGLYFGFGIFGIYAASVFDWVIKGTGFYLRYRYGSWKHMHLI